MSLGLKRWLLAISIGIPISFFLPQPASQLASAALGFSLGVAAYIVACLILRRADR